MYRRILVLLLWSIAVSPLFSQEKLIKIDYKLALSEIMLQDEATESDDESQLMMALLAEAFGADGKPQVQAWVNKQFIRVETQGIGENIQITDRNAGESYILYPSVKTYTKSEDAVDKVNIYETEDDIVVTSTADFPIRFVADTSKTIAGYPCKLAVLQFEAEELELDSTEEAQLEIWYNESLPSLYWGEYAYLKDIPGAALYIGAFGIGIEASAVNEVAFDATLFDIPEEYTLQDDPFAITYPEIPLGHNLYAFQDSSNNLIGLRNENDEVVAEPKYSFVNEFTGEHAVVMTPDLLYGIINTAGEEVIPCTREYLVIDPENDIIFFSNDGLTGIIDYDQNVIIPAEYDHISFFSNGYATFYKNDKQGLINLQGEIVVPANYDLILEYDQSHFIIQEDEQYYVVDIKTQQKTTPGYTYALFANEELVLVLRNEKYGYITKTGEIAIPFQYDYATPFFDGIASVMESEDGPTQYINAKGEFVEVEE